VYAPLMSGDFSVVANALIIYSFEMTELLATQTFVISTIGEISQTLKNSGKQNKFCYFDREKNLQRNTRF